LLKKGVCRLVKKISEVRLRPSSAERRAKNRRAEAYLGGTLERICLEREKFSRAIKRLFHKRLLKQAVGI